MQRVASFEYNDGYYSVLSQYWKGLEDDFGLIDPWDTVAFSGDGLEALIKCLTEARTDAASGPEAWAVHTGTLMSEPPEALYVPVQKSALLALIDQLLDAAESARREGGQLLFFGD